MSTKLKIFDPPLREKLFWISLVGMFFFNALALIFERIAFKIIATTFLISGMVFAVFFSIIILNMLNEVLNFFIDSVVDYNKSNIKNEKMKKIILLILISILTQGVNSQMDISENRIFSVTPYLGALNYLSTGYENLDKSNADFQMRTGAYFSLNVNKNVRINYDAVLELSSNDGWSLGIPYVCFGDTSDYGFKATMGISATPITKFTPHPLDLASQASFMSQRQVPGKTEHVDIKYCFQNDFWVGLGVGEDGPNLGDSLRSEIVLGYKGSSLGFYLSGSSPGGIINLSLFKERVTVFGYCRENIQSGYMQTKLGKEKQFALSVDMVYDHEKTNSDKLYTELIFLHFFDYPSAHLKNCAVGFGSTINSFNIYLLGQIF